LCRYFYFWASFEHWGGRGKGFPHISEGDSEAPEGRKPLWKRWRMPERVKFPPVPQIKKLLLVILNLIGDLRSSFFIFLII